MTQKLLLAYINWETDNDPLEIEVVDFPVNISLHEYMQKWQNEHKEQTLTQAYTIIAQHDIYGMHHEINKVKTIIF